MRTINEVLEQMVSILTSINFKEMNKVSSGKQKEELFKYLNEEFLNIEDYKHLLTNIKLSKENVLELLSLIFIVISDNKKIKFKDSFSETKKSISSFSERLMGL